MTTHTHSPTHTTPSHPTQKTKSETKKRKQQRRLHRKLESRSVVVVVDKTFVKQAQLWIIKTISPHSGVVERDGQQLCGFFQVSYKYVCVLPNTPFTFVVRSDVWIWNHIDWMLAVFSPSLYTQPHYYTITSTSPTNPRIPLKSQAVTSTIKAPSRRWQVVVALLQLVSSSMCFRLNAALRAPNFPHGRSILHV